MREIILEGIPLRELMDMGASVSCIWFCHRATLGALLLYHQVIREANGNPFPIARQTRYLSLKWGLTKGKDSFVVIARLVGTPALPGMDIMVPLKVQMTLTLQEHPPTRLHSPHYITFVAYGDT